MWVSLYLEVSEADAVVIGPEIKLADVLSYSRIAITDENNACEGIEKPNVGDVVGSIIEWNSLYKRNMTSYGCGDDYCVLDVTNCMPWQSTDCGQRILFFKINTQNQIDTTSFKCIDMPQLQQSKV